MTHQPRFRIALTNDFYDTEGRTKYRDIGLNLLESATDVTVERFGVHQPEIQPEQLVGVNGVIVLTPRVTAHSLSAADQLLGIGRFGVGFDNVNPCLDTVSLEKVVKMIQG